MSNGQNSGRSKIRTVKIANAYGALTLPSAAGRWQLLTLDEDEISLTALPYAIVKLAILP